MALRIESVVPPREDKPHVEIVRLAGDEAPRLIDTFKKEADAAPPDHYEAWARQAARLHALDPSRPRVGFYQMLVDGNRGAIDTLLKRASPAERASVKEEEDPQRFRVICTHLLSFNENARRLMLECTRVHSPWFIQQGDGREIARTFHEMSAAVTDNPLYLDFLFQQVSRSREAHKTRFGRAPNHFRIVTHCTRNIARPGRVFRLPEDYAAGSADSRHQDDIRGYALTAMPVERTPNATGAESTFYDCGAQEPFLRHTLGVGEAAIVYDPETQHGVTPLQTTDERDAVRTTVGLDEHIIDQRDYAELLERHARMAHVILEKNA